MTKKLLLALTMSAFVAASCSDDDDNNGPALPEYETISFEDCEFKAKHHDNLSSGTDIISFETAGVTFQNKNYYSMKSGVWAADTSALSDWDAEYSSAPSDKYVICNDTVNVFSGADNTKKYSVWAAHQSVTDVKPQLQLGEGVEKQVVSAKVNNVAQYWHYMKAGFYSTKPFNKEDGDFYEVAFVGYDATGVKTGEVSVTMADFRDGKEEIMQEWTEVNLSALGKVNRIELVATPCPKFAEAFYVDKIFSICVDEIKFIKEKEVE